MDQIFIKDLLAHGIIGVTEKERSQPQKILINVTLYTDFNQTSQTDEVKDTVNYSTVAKSILAFVETAKRHTVEALAVDLAGLCLENPAVEKVRIRVEKPGAVRFSASVGVEIERHKSA